MPELNTTALASGGAPVTLAMTLPTLGCAREGGERSEKIRMNQQFG